MNHGKMASLLGMLGLVGLLGGLLAGAAQADVQRGLVTDQVILRPRVNAPYLVQADYSLASLRQGLRSAARAALDGQGLAFQQVSALPHLGLAVARLAPGQKEVVSRLTRGGQVHWAEHPRQRMLRALPGDPLFSYQWALNNTGDQSTGQDLSTRFSWTLALRAGAHVGALAAWERTKGNPRDVIAVLDSGVEYDHIDLIASMWINPGEVPGNGVDDDYNGFVDDYHGYDYWNFDGEPKDDNGHGTLLAGIIAAAENAVGTVGLAPGVKVMAVKVFDSQGSGSDLDVVWGIEYVLNVAWRGVPVRAVNMSFGGPGYSRALHEAVAALGDLGILVMVAAGNSGQNLDFQPSDYPSCLPEPNVITVGLSDGQDQPVGWSAWGAYAVDLFAPGFNILSTAARVDHTENAFILGVNHWVGASGTSFSAPHVAAAAALAWDLHPQADWRQIKALLLESGQPLDSLQGLARDHSRLDADRATSMALPSGPHLFRLSDLLPAPGQVTTLYGMGLGSTPGVVRVNGLALQILGWEENQVRLRLPPASSLREARANLSLTTSQGRSASMPFLLAQAGGRQEVRVHNGDYYELWPTAHKQALLDDRLWGVVDQGYDQKGNPALGWGYLDLAQSRLVLDGPLPPGLDAPEDTALVTHANAIYCLGGSTSNLVHRFDPASGQWDEVSKAPYGDELVEPVVASDGIYIYLAGGLLYPEGQDTPNWLARVYRWDPARDLWQQIANMPQAMARGTALVSERHLILVGGYLQAHDTWTQGNLCQVLDLATGLWQENRLPFSSLDGGLAVRQGWLYFHGAGAAYGSASPFVARASLKNGVPQAWEVPPRRLGFVDVLGDYSWVWADQQGLSLVGPDSSGCPVDYCSPVLRRFDLAWEQ